MRRSCDPPDDRGGASKVSASCGRSSPAIASLVSMSERDGLIARIRHVRRAAATTQRPSGASPAGPDVDAIRGLETRVAHLEQLVEGLQDSVHREFERQGKLIAHLEAQTQPAAMGAALDKDARDRGL